MVQAKVNSRTEQRVITSTFGLALRALSLSEQLASRPNNKTCLYSCRRTSTRSKPARNWQRWRSLTPREQQVAALVCLNLTGRQVAAKLFISPETVKTHVRSILRKFDLGSRQELRQVLAGWDFSAWLELGNG